MIQGFFTILHCVLGLREGNIVEYYLVTVDMLRVPIYSCHGHIPQQLSSKDTTELIFTLEGWSRECLECGKIDSIVYAIHFVLRQEDAAR